MTRLRRILLLILATSVITLLTLIFSHRNTLKKSKNDSARQIAKIEAEKQKVERELTISEIRQSDLTELEQNNFYQYLISLYELSEESLSILLQLVTTDQTEKELAQKTIWPMTRLKRNDLSFINTYEASQDYH